MMMNPLSFKIGTCEKSKRHDLQFVTEYCDWDMGHRGKNEKKVGKGESVKQ